MDSEIIVQTNDGGYAGPLLEGRFQVLESFVPRGTYYIADHKQKDLLVRVDGRDSDIRRFPSIKSAEEVICKSTNKDRLDKDKALPRLRTPPAGNTQESLDQMARNPQANAAAIKAATEADKKIGVKAAAKQADAAAQMKKAVAGAKPGKPAPVVKMPPAPSAAQAKGIKDVSGRTGTIAAMFRSLIAAPGKRTDEQIHAEVEEAFGKKIAKNAVSHYRADLERRKAAGKS